MNKKLKKIIISALFAALTFCATFVVKIPTPTGGYVHLGDSIVLLSGWLLGPVFGTLAAALGSALSDLLGGYPTYILPTFIIKGLMALIENLLGYLAYRILTSRYIKSYGCHFIKPLYHIHIAAVIRVIVAHSYFLPDYPLLLFYRLVGEIRSHNESNKL